MKQFDVIIKSHTFAPDYEDTITANSREEVADYLNDRFGIDKDYLLKYCISEGDYEIK